MNGSGLVWGTWENEAMERQRGELVPIGEVVRARLEKQR